MCKTKQKLLAPTAASIALLASVTIQAADAPPEAPVDLWRNECSSCHIAYSPKLLPVASWRELMRTLDKHFGVDASVDQSVATQIAKYLEANAGRERGTPADTPITRITELSWFKREHDEAASYVGPSKKVPSWSDCAACHTGADQGRFNERDIRIPK